MNGNHRTRIGLVLALLLIISLTGCARAATVESLQKATSNGQAPPQGFTAVNQDGGVKLDWEPVEDAKGYEIQYSTDRVNWTLFTDSTINVESGTRLGGYSTDSGLEQGAASFRIRTIFGSKTVSDWSDEASIGDLSDIPAGCLEAMRRIANDQAGTAEAAFRDSVTDCRTAQEWKSAARVYPDALGVMPGGDIDVDGWLNTICATYSDAAACNN